MTEVSNVANTVLTSLDVGSGVDSVKLAQDLTDAIKIPQQNNIQGQIDASEASISAYALVKYQIDQLRGSFENLNDVSELSTSSGSTSDATKMTASEVLASASPGVYDFSITQLAQNQRVHSDQYSSSTQSLNGGSAFDISLAVGTTKSAVPAVYGATASASETTTLVVGDGTNTVSVASATYTSVGDQVSAIQSASGYNDLLFTVGLNSNSDGIVFTYKLAGSVSSTPTFTGSGSTHTITNSTIGVSVATAVTGVAAEYAVSGTPAGTKDLTVSDGVTSVTIDESTYTSIAEQVTAIQSGVGYSNLKFTVTENLTNDGFVFNYKTTGAVVNAPTMTGGGSNYTVNNSLTGVTAINSPTITSIAVDSDTPGGVVNAINAAKTGVTATLVNTGTTSNSYKILLSGPTGESGSFTLTSSPDLGFHDTANTLQLAQDSIFEFEGMTLRRSDNVIDDVIDGVTLNLQATTASDVAITINSDRSTLKSAIQTMVSAYNDLLTLFDTVTDKDSDLELAGSLSDDASVTRYLKNKIRSTILSDSSTPSGTMTALRDIGISVNQYGRMTFTESTYSSAIKESYDDIVTMLTADTDNHNLFESSHKGLAQDIASILTDFTDADGLVSLRESGAKTALTNNEDKLTKLEERMEVVYNRYLLQFGTMEKLMVTLDSTKDYLKSQFESLSKAYDD
jgi:flagellar hook-associated protein 2